VSEREAASSHLPVLVDEVAFLLRPRGAGWVVDGTVGMGGHAERMLETTSADTRLFGIDADAEALARAARRLERFGARVRLAHGSFRDLAALAAAAGVDGARSILLDLGVSSYQLDEAGRGFSFQREEPLDMRFDPSRGPTAAAVLARLPEAELARILREYGDEPHARRIAGRIVERRRRSPLRSTLDLVEAVKAAVPRAAWPRRLHVATRTFQAVRMAVNAEPEALQTVVPAAARLLTDGGRLGVIAFHSGEDRIVKRAFRALLGAGFVQLDPAPLGPGRAEVIGNPRARSARLRVLERAEAA
jgi:16S rRNA (cytosine1402-N4)-methyltransferase